MALPSLHRLKSRQDFQAVFREGIRRHGSYLTLRALRPSPSTLRGAITSPNVSPNVSPTPNSVDVDTADFAVSPEKSYLDSPTLIGISVSTKVSKRAVVRNRIKRRIAGALHQLLPRLLPGWRLVIVVKTTAAQECVTQQFLQELEQLLVQAEVINGHS